MIDHEQNGKLDYNLNFIIPRFKEHSLINSDY